MVMIILLLVCCSMDSCHPVRNMPLGLDGVTAPSISKPESWFIVLVVMLQ